MIKLYVIIAYMISNVYQTTAYLFTYRLSLKFEHFFGEILDKFCPNIMWCQMINPFVSYRLHQPNRWTDWQSLNCSGLSKIYFIHNIGVKHFCSKCYIPSYFRKRYNSFISKIRQFRVIINRMSYVRLSVYLAAWSAR